MIHFNFWSNARLHNGAKGGVVGFVYNEEEGSRHGNISEENFVHCYELYDNFEPFLP